MIDLTARRARAQRHRLLEGANWNDIYQRLARHARGRLGRKAPEADAEELVQQAIAKFIEGGSDTWDPERQSLTEAIGSRLNGLIANHKRKRREALGQTEDALELAEDRLRAPRGDEEDHITRDYARRALERIRQRLEKDVLALSLLSQFEEGIELPLDQAAALGCTMRDLLAARKRLERCVQRVAAELEEGDDHG